MTKNVIDTVFFSIDVSLIEKEISINPQGKGFALKIRIRKNEDFPTLGDVFKVTQDNKMTLSNSAMNQLSIFARGLVK